MLGIAAEGAPILASVKFIEARLAEPFLKLNPIARYASTPPASSLFLICTISRRAEKDA
jgi:hypothetical protein